MVIGSMDSGRHFIQWLDQNAVPEIEQLTQNEVHMISVILMKKTVNPHFDLGQKLPDIEELAKKIKKDWSK